MDRDTNTISLIDTVEAIKYIPLEAEALAGVAGLPLEMDLVTLWVRGDPKIPEYARSRLRVELPNGDVEAVGETTDVDLREFQRLRARAHLGGIPLSGSGRYFFVVQIEREGEWQTAARVPMDVEGPERPSV